MPIKNAVSKGWWNTIGAIARSHRVREEVAHLLLCRIHVDLKNPKHEVKDWNNGAKAHWRKKRIHGIPIRLDEPGVEDA